MGLLDWLRRALAGGPAERARRGERGRSRRPARDTGLGLMELSRRLGLPVSDLQLAPVSYDEFRIPKRGGGARTILAPNAKLKALQRRVLHRLLGRLKAHPAAMGFERGRSIVTHARLHAAPAVIVRMDVREFFPSTEAHRVREYFRAIGWGSEAVMLLMKWCTWEGGLPQGAPTSPRLSNLVNYRMDARLAGLAAALGATYSRYADDLAFSFARDDRQTITAAIRSTKLILADYGYMLHLKRKLSIRRRHQRQAVTGLVVNDGVRLPRETRRLLRAARHRLAAGRPATLTPEQLAGWGAFLGMVERQAGSR
ncbi:MAG TPA: reverse transcriptase family protein [Phycisphaerae bacterium]|nr:reverse transcriptase family protein [Phycisphaerae bacterium]